MPAVTSAFMQAELVDGRPVENRIIHIEVYGITSTDGAEMSEAFESYYVTALDPYYSNYSRIMMLAGEFLNGVPEHTIDMMIHYFSILADDLNYSPECAALDPHHYMLLVREWVTLSTAWSFLARSGLGGKMVKKLADLSVSRSDALDELMNRIRPRLNELEDLLKNGGDWGCHGIETPRKGEYNINDKVAGRMWARSQETDLPYPNIPSVNSRGTIRDSYGRVKRAPKHGWSKRR